VSRIIAASVLGLLWLATAPLCLSQTRDRRLDEALAEITLLKRLVKEQDRRIADLEKAVKSAQAVQAAQAAPVANPENPGEERAKPIVKPPAARWQNPLAWSLIREGMSRAQVEELLGKPTTVEAVIDYQTLVYKGDVPGAGSLSGAVKLTDDRVVEANPPAF
jgi:hypothetical protein